VTQSSDLKIPEDYDHCDTKQEYVKELIDERENGRLRYNTAMRLFNDFDKSIRRAAIAGCLSQEELQALKVKLLTVNDYIPQRIKGGQRLIDPALEIWW
jgi:hypothetical protein